MGFDYNLDYKSLNFRDNPWDYKVGKGEQGVLLVEPYKSELLPYWKFRTPKEAAVSARKIFLLFKKYKSDEDFIGMDMARKFLQMGFTRSRRYANHRSGKKYEGERLLPRDEDPEKAKSAKIFFKFWKRVENDSRYRQMKSQWQEWFG
ncbi:MAG: DUF4385 domain-containing protein [Bdellovibrionota bacterium]